MLAGFHPEGIIFGGGGGGGGTPGNGCGFIYFSIQLSQILGGGGGEVPPTPTPPPPLDETLVGYIIYVRCIIIILSLTTYCHQFFYSYQLDHKTIISQKIQFHLLHDHNIVVCAI